MISSQKSSTLLLGLGLSFVTFCDKQEILTWPQNVHVCCSGIIRTEKNIIRTDELQDITIVYPQYDPECDLLNQEIEKIVCAELHNFTATWQKEYEENASPDSPWPPFHFAFSCSYRVAHEDNELISILLRFERYIGGAHGQRTFKSFNYDRKNNKMITIEELVSEALLPTLSSLCSQSLESQGMEIYYKEGIEPVYDNFRHVTCTPDTITIQFDEYQVCCYAMGAPSVTIAQQ